MWIGKLGDIMFNKVTFEEQKEMGMIRQSPRFLPAKTHNPRELSHTDQNLMGNAVSAAAEMTARRQMGHIVRSDNDAVIEAKASLLYSLSYGVAAGLIIGAVCYVGYLNEGGGGEFYTLIALFFWGLAVLVSLMLNRKQGLHHSSTGIAHAEIESRERVALHTINQHVELIKEKWKIDNER